MKWFVSSRISLASVIAVTVFALPTVVWSQTAEWTVYNTANSGLPYNGVTALTIDAQGIIWVGTARWYALAGGGLARFDGENWTVYNTGNSDLPSNDHTGLSIDPQGNVWSATESGLARFDGENWAVYKTHNSGLRDNQMGGAPAFDAEGNAWIPTFGGGLAKFDGANWTVYNTSNSGLPNNRVGPIAFDAQGNLWMGTWGGGLAKFDGENWTVYNTGNSALPHNTIASLSIDVQDNVWIGTINGGLAKFDGDNWMVYNTGNSVLPNNRIWNLAVGAQGNIWAATGGGGLAKFDGTNWTVYNTGNSGLPDNMVYSLAIDAQTNVWIGTQSGGLAVYRPEPAVDFNGDGIVDCVDMCMMIDHWGTDEPLFDIAPRPFGDGIVDVQDLILLSEHLFEENFPPELVAYWKLDETEGDIAYDSVAVNDAVVFGDAIWQPDGGQINGALQFDGIDDYLSADFMLDRTDAKFSVFAWVKGGMPGQVVFSQAGASDWLGAKTTNGSLMTELKFLFQLSRPLQSQTVITDGQWHHIGLVYDRDGLCRYLYVDGAEVAKDIDSVAGIHSYSGLYIGAGKNLDAGTFFSGLIDDVRIYNRAVTP